MPKKKKVAEKALNEPTIKKSAFFSFGQEAIGLMIYDNNTIQLTLYDRTGGTITKYVDMKED